MFGISYEGKECPNGHTLKNGIVYENPEVILSYEGDISKNYYFETYEEAKQFALRFTKGENWLN